MQNSQIPFPSHLTNLFLFSNVFIDIRGMIYSFTFNVKIFIQHCYIFIQHFVRIPLYASLDPRLLPALSFGKMWPNFRAKTKQYGGRRKIEWTGKLANVSFTMERSIFGSRQSAGRVRTWMGLNERCSKRKYPDQVRVSHTSSSTSTAYC